MADFNVSAFTQQYSDDYARPNLFEVEIQDLGGQAVCKAASLPAATVGVVEVPYQNRKLKVPGDRVFQDWTVTIINDDAYSLRDGLLQWQNGIQGDLDMTQGNGGVGPSHRSITVRPFDRDGSAGLGAVDLYGWPSEIGAIDLSWETNDAVQEYTVTFSISWDNSYSGDNVAAL